MSFLSDAGKVLLGNTLTDAQAQLDIAEQQLTIAFSTSIALQAIIAVQLFLILVMQWKERH
jgi:hypothetical protein